MSRVIGKLSRIFLVIGLFAIIFLILALLVVTSFSFLFESFFNNTHPLAEWIMSNFFDLKNLHQMFSLAHFIKIGINLVILIAKNIIFSPILFMCIAVITLIILQALRANKISKMILRADNMPNDYKFEAPKSDHPKTSMILKIVLAGLLAIIFIVCVVAKDVPKFAIIVELINKAAIILSNVRQGLSSGIVFGSVLSIIHLALQVIPYLIYTSLFLVIQTSCVFGIISVFTGGRSDEIKELDETVEQKSRFAKVREMEESEELDELSQLF